MSDKKPLLRLENLTKHFPITKGVIVQKQVGAVQAVDNISFEILDRTHDEQVERRIHQLAEHYQGVQEERGEVWYPPEEATAVDILNERGMFGRTPLIQAAYDDNLKEVERLLKLGANPALKDSSGNDALQIAIINGYEKVAARLKKEFVRSPFDLSV